MLAYQVNVGRRGTSFTRGCLAKQRSHSTNADKDDGCIAGIIAKAETGLARHTRYLRSTYPRAIFKLESLVILSNKTLDADATRMLSDGVELILPHGLLGERVTVTLDDGCLFGDNMLNCLPRHMKRCM